MNRKFRDQVQEMANDAMTLLAGSLKGKKVLDNGLFSNCIRVLGMGVKVEHMDQISEGTNKSLALRLLVHLPKDETTREEYIKMTNPDLRQLLDTRRRVKMIETK